MVAYILDGDLRRDVIDDLAQEGIVAIAFLFEVSPFRDIFDRGNPAATRQRLVDDLDCTSVRGFQGTVGDLALRNVSQNG